MLRWRWWFLLLLPVLLDLPSMLYTVDGTEFVVVTQFGRLVQIYDGSDQEQAGLHLKWPWPVQTVKRIDRRLQTFDLPGTELLTRDPRADTIDKTLAIDAYVCWRIPDVQGVERFIPSLGTVERTQQVLGQRISSELGAAITQMELDDLINTDSARVDRQRERLRQVFLSDLETSLRSSARARYGIEVVDVRLRRSNHPPAVRDAIFDRIRSERAKKAEEYRSEGKRLADNIRSESEREVSEMKARAEARALALRGEAEAEADRIRSEAGARDPKFYTFLRQLEEYQRFLGDNKTTLLLSTHRGMFAPLFDPPAPEKERTRKGGPDSAPGEAGKP
jgi:membrane protease subunit HflC